VSLFSLLLRLPVFVYQCYTCHYLREIEGERREERGEERGKRKEERGKRVKDEGTESVCVCVCECV
jgi:hypothetical protein